MAETKLKNQSRDTVIEAGLYTPTLSAVYNVQSLVLNGDFFYQRIGDVVIVSGGIQIDPTAAGTVQVNVSLPIASNFTGYYDLNGNASNPTASYPAGSIISDPTNDKAQVNIYAPDGSNQWWRLLFMYIIK